MPKSSSLLEEGEISDDEQSRSFNSAANRHRQHEKRSYNSRNSPDKRRRKTQRTLPDITRRREEFAKNTSKSGSFSFVKKRSLQRMRKYKENLRKVNFTSVENVQETLPARSITPTLPSGFAKFRSSSIDADEELDERDYVDSLLDEYDEVNKKLQTLDNAASAQSDSVADINADVVDMELDSDVGEDSFDNIEVKNEGKHDVDDDDTELLQLRLAALKSTARHVKITEEDYSSQDLLTSSVKFSSKEFLQEKEMNDEEKQLNCDEALSSILDKVKTNGKQDFARKVEEDFVNKELMCSDKEALERKVAELKEQQKRLMMVEEVLTSKLREYKSKEDHDDVLEDGIKTESKEHEESSSQPASQADTVPLSDVSLSEGEEILPGLNLLRKKVKSSAEEGAETVEDMETEISEVQQLTAEESADKEMLDDDDMEALRASLLADVKTKRQLQQEAGSSSEPAVSSQELAAGIGPAVSNQEPLAASQESSVTSTKPAITSQEPVVSQVPIVASQVHVVVWEEPFVARQARVVAREEPVVPRQAQVVAREEPVVATKKPLIHSHEPGQGAVTTSSSQVVDVRIEEGTADMEIEEKEPEEEEEDEDLLRATLLADVASRRMVSLKKAQSSAGITTEHSDIKCTVKNSLASTDSRLDIKQLYKIEPHDKVVIDLNTDSEDSEDDIFHHHHRKDTVNKTTSRRVDVVAHPGKNMLLGRGTDGDHQSGSQNAVADNVEKFLKQMRATVEAKSSQVNKMDSSFSTTNDSPMDISGTSSTVPIQAALNSSYASTNLNTSSVDVLEEKPLAEEEHMVASAITSTLSSSQTQEEVSLADKIIQESMATKLVNTNSGEGPVSTVVQEKPTANGSVVSTEEIQPVTQTQLVDLERKALLQKKLLEDARQKLSHHEGELKQKKKKINVCDSHIEKLREQLAEAQKIRIATVKDVASIKEKVDSLKTEVSNRQSKYLETHKTLVSVGQSLVGPTYSPKRRQENFKPAGVINSRHKLVKYGSFKKLSDSEKSKAATNLDELRQKLEEQKKQLEVAINQEKQKRRRRLLSTSSRRKHVRRSLSNLNKDKAGAANQLEHVHTEEKMDLASTSGVESPKHEAEREVCETSVRPKLGKTLEPSTNADYKQSAKRSGDGQQGKNWLTEDKLQAARRFAVKELFNLLEESSGIEDTNKPLSPEAPLQYSFTVFSPNQKLKLLQNCISKTFVQSSHDTQKSQPVNGSALYRSKLLRFRSYRFSPYFRSAAGLKLNSVTFSNKLQPLIPFCTFDLHGKCLDKKCKLQHMSELTLSTEELLVDLVSFCPTMAHVPPDADSETVPERLKKYVQTFCKTKSKATKAEQAILLASDVMKAAKLASPFFMFLNARKWQLTSAAPRHRTIEETEVQSVSVQTRDPYAEICTSPVNMVDDDIVDHDVRYWLAEGRDGQAPNDLNLKNVRKCIKMAYHQLTLGGKNGLESALNIFSKGIEANKHSTELWNYYVNLYAQHPEQTDVSELCEQGIKFAPSYQLYRQYLQLVHDHQKKLNICADAEKFVMNCDALSSSLKSTTLLEVRLTAVQTLLHREQLIQAVEKCKALYTMDESFQHLSGLDTVLACLCYLSLLHHGRLPKQLFDESEKVLNLSVYGKPVLINWKEGGYSEAELAFMERAWEEVVILSSEKLGLLKYNPQEFQALQLKELIILFRNWAAYLISTNREDKAALVFQKIIQLPEIENHSSYVELCLEISTLNAKLGFSDTAEKILFEASQKFRLNSHLAFQQASLVMAHGNEDQALTILETFPFFFFEVDLRDTGGHDPNSLYCKLLNHPLPEKYIPPPMKKSTSSLIKDQELYLWLCYCLLLEVQGFEFEVVAEAFEAALSSLCHIPDDYKTLWLNYLRLSYQRGSVSTSAALLSKFPALVRRALSSVPASRCRRVEKSSLSNSSALDYSFHNVVISFLLGVTPSVEQGRVYEELVKMMPDNPDLIIRAVSFFYQAGDLALARGAVEMAMVKLPKNLPVIRSYLFITSKQQTKDLSKICQILEQSIEFFPECLLFWKYYVLFGATCSFNKDKLELIQHKARAARVDLSTFLESVIVRGNK